MDVRNTTNTTNKDITFGGLCRNNLGHYHVDFESPNRTRTPKESAAYYRKVVTSNCLLEFCEPSAKKIQLL